MRALPNGLLHGAPRHPEPPPRQDPVLRFEGGETVTRKSRERAVQARNACKFIPPIDGIDKQGVHSCKQLAAADRLDQYQGSAAVVIGSRAIGIEDGEALKKRGYEVTIIELLDWVSPPPTRAHMPSRAHFCDTHAVTFGKTTRAAQCELGQLELIERDEGEDYLGSSSRRGWWSAGRRSVDLRISSGCLSPPCGARTASPAFEPTGP